MQQKFMWEKKNIQPWLNKRRKEDNSIVWPFTLGMKIGQYATKHNNGLSMT